MLSSALKSLPVGTAYAVRVGIGALGVAIAGIVALGESASPLRLGLPCADPGRDRQSEVRRGMGQSRARPSCLSPCRRHASQPVRQDGEPALWSKRRTAQPKCSATYALVLGNLRRRWDYTVSRWSANPLG
jgi:Small Multidrug Resistance protein